MTDQPHTLVLTERQVQRCKTRDMYGRAIILWELRPEVVAWCEARSYEPDVMWGETDPPRVLAHFPSAEHAFEFKVRWL